MHTNNNGLFRGKNSSDSPISVHYRSQTARLKHRRVKRKLLDGAGDLQCTPSPSTQSKQIDFSELEEIFDTAIRNRLPIHLYKDEKPLKTRDELVQRQPSVLVDRVSSVPFQYPSSETRLNLIIPPLQKSSSASSSSSCASFLRKHRLFSALTLVTCL